MEIEGRTILILGGYGLVGTAVCRQLLRRRPQEIIVHSLRPEEAEEARRELGPEVPRGTTVSTLSGDIFGLASERSTLERLAAQLRMLEDAHLPEFLLYQQLLAARPHIVIDCVNTATAIAYRDIHRAAEAVWRDVASGQIRSDTAESLLDALYIPRLIRHIQVLYRGMTAAGTKVYIKVGTTGTGGMGLNVPYTHSEEKPSRVLLSKSAVAGAHSMLLFLMARTPDAPITKEIKPAAAIAWKRIAAGPIVRKGRKLTLVEAEPRPLGDRFSTHDPRAARDTGEPLETVYIDTGENGIFSLEEFALLTTARQMEFVTPEEIAQYLLFEIEGGNTGHDLINALDNAVLGPTYRAGVLRHRALEKMTALEGHYETKSVAFEMLGPPRNSKLLFEAHLLREVFGSMEVVRQRSAEEVAQELDRALRERPRLAAEIASVGLPVLLPSGEIIRAQGVIVPAEADDEVVTPEKLERWVEAGWVDLRPANCGRWIARFRRIHEEIAAIPAGDTSSRFLRDRYFWNDEQRIEPGKTVGWILSVEEHGARIKR